ncbi:MAG: hypothetical protein ACRDT6_05540 [Micromonosporaceae bacterium]
MADSSIGVEPSRTYGRSVTIEQTAPDAAPTAPPAPARTWLATVAIAVTVVLWASAFVAIRYVGTDLSPGPLALGRLLIGRRARRGDPARLAGAGRSTATAGVRRWCALPARRLPVAAGPMMSRWA